MHAMQASIETKNKPDLRPAYLTRGSTGSQQGTELKFGSAQATELHEAMRPQLIIVTLWVDESVVDAVVVIKRRSLRPSMATIAALTAPTLVHLPVLVGDRCFIVIRCLRAYRVHRSGQRGAGGGQSGVVEVLGLVSL